jgi:two-component system alkaline phosphatase synthesis response regulator PhoP
MTTSRKRILIGEDDQHILKMTKLRLEHEGYDVVTAEDGEEVLRRAGDELPIHLILLDIKMPKLNGYDVCRTLKGQPVTAQIPIVVFSASESHLQHLADRCIEVGAKGWLRKPFRTQELMKKVRQALGEEGGSDG